MAKVLVSDQLSKDGLAILEQAQGIELDNRPGLSEEELAKAVAGADGLVIRSGSKVTARVLEAADKLRVIGRAGIGVDNVDLPAATKKGILVMNTPTANSVTTAEHAIGLMFALSRKVPAADASMKAGKWEKKKFGGREISGKTLGIIGLGTIGSIVADRANGLKMHLLAYDPMVSEEHAVELGAKLVSLDELFAKSDIITIHTPLNEHTKHIVNDAAIEKMKPGVLLVNAARGGVYDEAAVLRGLESGKIAGAAFDVYVEEPPGATDLVKHPDVVSTPHLGASTKEAQNRVSTEIAHQVVAFLREGKVINAVNKPGA